MLNDWQDKADMKSPFQLFYSIYLYNVEQRVNPHRLVASLFPWEIYLLHISYINMHISHKYMKAQGLDFHSI